MLRMRSNLPLVSVKCLPSKAPFGKRGASCGTEIEEKIKDEVVVSCLGRRGKEEGMIAAFFQIHDDVQ